MSALKFLSTFFILGVFLFSSCTEKHEFEPYLKGDIIGYAYCFDEFGNELDDFSGIQVFTEPDRKYNAITDEDGRYVIENVVNGTYDLSFEKEGFGTMKLYSEKHLGGQPTVLECFSGGKAPFIYQNITTQITNLEFVDDSVSASVSHSGYYIPSQLHLRFFFSTQQNFNSESAMAIKNIVLVGIDDHYGSFESVTEGLPFEQGEMVYYKAGIYTSVNTVLLRNYYYLSGADTYIDYESNRTIYPNLSEPTEEFSFIMP